MDVCAQPLLDVMQQGHVGRVVEAARLKAVGEQLLGVRHARLGEGHRLVLLVDGVVAGGLEPIAVLGLDLALVDLAFLQLRNDPIHLVVEVGRLLGRARDDQWRARFIDEDAVHFVHDGEVVASLDHAPQVELHVVAQVVEPELVVRPVGDVAPVGDLALLIGQLVLNHANGVTEEPVDAAHPLRVAAGQVVVDRHDVDALALERIEIGGKRGDQRLAFAGLHLCDGAVVQHHAADELDVVVPHVEHAAAGLPHHGEGLGQQLVERLAAPQALAERGRLSPQLRVAEGFDRRFEAVDAVDERPQTLQLTIVLGANDLGEKLTKHVGMKAGCLSHDYTGWRLRPETSSLEAPQPGG